MDLRYRLKNDIEKYKENTIIVEGKKDVKSLNYLGFQKVYAIHEISVPIREKINQICSTLDKKETVCVLTDLDKKGNILYQAIIPILQENGVKIDSTFRNLLMTNHVSHIEGLYSFISKLD